MKSKSMDRQIKQQAQKGGAIRQMQGFGRHTARRAMAFIAACSLAVSSFGTTIPAEEVPYSYTGAGMHDLVQSDETALTYKTDADSTIRTDEMPLLLDSSPLFSEDAEEAASYGATDFMDPLAEEETESESEESETTAETAQEAETTAETARESETTAETVQESETTAETAQEAETTAETVQESETSAETAQEPETTAETVKAETTETAETAAEAEKSAQEVTDEEAETTTETAAQEETKAEEETQPETKAEEETQPETKAETEVQSETSGETEPAIVETETETQSETEPETVETETQSETEPATVETETETQSETDPAIVETETETESEAESEEIETESETESETETEETEVLSYKSENFEVYVSYTPEAKIPERSIVRAREVTSTVRVDALLDEAQSALNLESNDDQKVTGRFFDIIIRDPEGMKVEPAAPVTVKVTMTSNYAKELRSEPQVVHFEKNDTGIAPVEVTVTDSRQDEKQDNIEFQAESFSVYGIVYTVDFETISGGTYSIPGEGSYKLNDLLPNIIGKEAMVSDASLELIEGEEIEGALYLTKGEDGEWYINSDVAFDTTYELTMFVDEAKYVVIVRDEQASSSSNLADFLTNASIAAPVNDAGKYLITPDTSYDISLSFAENKNLQFDNNGNLTYDLSNSGLEFTGLEQNGKFTIKVNDGGTFYNIENNTFSIDETGHMTVSFNRGDPNFSILTASNNLKYTINIDAKVRSDASKITFSDGVEKDIEIDTSNSVSASKSASFNKDKGTVDYTVAVVSEGVSNNVVVKDTITGAALTLDANSIKATSSTGQPVSMTGGVSVNSFEYTIGTMKNGEVVTFTYSANVLMSQIHYVDGKYISTGNNRVEVKSDGDPEPDIVDRTTTIDYTPTIEKSNGEIIEDKGETKILSWTITANEDCKVSMAGGRITDNIAPGSQSIMKYYGSGIKVDVYDASGNLVRTDEPEWEELANKSDSTWTYMVPTNDKGKAYKYVITYKTEVNVKGKVSATTVDNTVQTDGGKIDSGQGTVPAPPGSEVKIKKTLSNIDLEKKEVTWNISFDVPEDGLTEAVVTDIYPNINVSSGPVFEKYVPGSLQITGIREDLGETYREEHNINTTGNPNYVQLGSVITFYKDSDKQHEGLQALGARTIFISLKTEINSEWLDESRIYDWMKGHTNNVQIIANGDKKTSQATALINSQNLKKDASFYKTRTENGIEYPVYRYVVRIDNVTSDINVIKDSYDTSLLEPYNEPSDAFYLGYGNEYNPYDGWFTDTPASYVETPTGMTITTSDQAIAKKDDGSYYPAYWLYYYLTVKDEAALKTIMGRAIANDGKYTMDNTAEWNDITDGADVTYKYNALDKEILTDEEELKKTDEDIWAEFRITLNPGAMMLNGGEPLTMTDTINNLSIDYESIRANPSSGVTWDQSNSITTFTIPDQTKVVITYRARVLFKTIGESGQTIKVDFNNVAEMDGYRDEISGSGERHNSGQGAASVPVINLFKYRAGSMNEPLAGAVFELLDENKEPVTWGKEFEDHKVGDPVQFTTGTDGRIHVRGDEENYGWSINEETRYYLREIYAPEGYMLADFDYSFKISSDGTTDYSDPEWKYHTGDTMSAKNYPGTDVRVEKKWIDSQGRDVSQQHVEDIVTVKLQQKMLKADGSGEWSDTIRMQVKNSSTGLKEWKDVNGKTVTLQDSNEWKDIFYSLPLKVPVDISNPDGEDIDVEYQIVETAINGKPLEEAGVTSHEIVRDGTRYSYTVKNIVKPGTGSLKLTKVVKVNDSAPVDNAEKKLVDGAYIFKLESGEGITPVLTKYIEITVANGTATSYKVADSESALVTASSVVGSPAVIGNLPEGDYTITETNKNGLQLTGIVRGDGNTSAVDLKNDKVTVHVTAGEDNPDESTAAVAEFTNNIDAVKAKVVKVWDDNGNSNRPRSLRVTLSNGTEVTLPDANGKWEATITGLPKYDSITGQEIEYSWTEEALSSGYYLSNYKEEKDGTTGVITSTLTNSISDHYNPLTNIKGKKIWDDGGREDRPDSITVILKNGSEEVARQTVSKPTAEDANKDQWPFEFTNLPVFNEDGSIIQYTVEEVLPEGYSSVYGIKVEFEQATYIAGDVTGTIVNSYAQDTEICRETDLGYIVIRHGQDYVVWTPRPLQDGELDKIKTKVKTLSDQFSGIDNPHSIRYINGVPSSVGVGSKPNATVKMVNGTVWVHFDKASSQSDIAYGKIPYTYTSVGGEGGGSITNTSKLTDFEFSKKWLNNKNEEINWDRDIQITVNRKVGETKDESFSLVYDITKSAVEDSHDGKVEFTATGGTESTPKLVLTIVEENSKKYYNFKIDNLEYSNDNNGKYIYYAVETNNQLEFYLRPSYSNVSAPTGATEAYDGGTIINQMEGGVVLPSTGGPGTLLYSMLGMMLIALSGTAYMILLRRRRASLKGGDNPR